MSGRSSSDNGVEGLHITLLDLVRRSALSDQEYLPAGALKRLVTPENVMQEFPSMSIDMLNFVCEPAQKIFAILLCACGDSGGLRGTNLESIIESFYKCRFTDKLLPIDNSTVQDNCDVEFRLQCSHSEALEVFHAPPWGKREVAAFYKTQWIFLAPEFTIEPSIYDLDEEIPLPFTKAYFLYPKHHSRLIEIHKDHLPNLSEVDGKQCRFLVKDIKMIYVGNKLLSSTLSKMDELKHPHLQAPFATILTPSRCWLIFGWFDRGSLEDMWENDLRRPNLSGDFIYKVLCQLLGVADALHALHKAGIHYAGLALEQIFSATANNEVGPIGLLQLADPVYGIFGRKKYHESTTYSRPKSERANPETWLRYQPPDMQSSSPSQFGNIWSLGCIFLESTIWLLYGYEELLRFRCEAKDSYYTFSGGSRLSPAERSTVLNKWAKHISKDPECKKETALRDFFSLVNDKMLVIAIPPQNETKSPATDSDARIPFTAILPQFEIDSSATRFGDITLEITPPTNIEKKSFAGGSKSGSKGKFRASGAECCKEIKRILQYGTKKKQYLFTGTGRQGLSGPKNR